MSRPCCLLHLLFIFLQEMHASQLEEETRKTNRKVNQIQEQEKLERSSWKQHVTEKMNAVLKEKEVELKQRLTAERDQQLEMDITRLGEETHGSQKQLAQKYERERGSTQMEHKKEVERLLKQVAIPADKPSLLLFECVQNS